MRFFTSFEKDADDCQLMPLASPAAKAKYNRQTKAELRLNYKKLFVELTTSATLSGNVYVKDSLSVAESGSKYETIARIWTQKTKSVVPFVKLAFSDLIECLTDGPSGSTIGNCLPESYAEKDNNSTPNNRDENAESVTTSLQKIVQNIGHKKCEHNIAFKRRVVFDLDHLAKSSEPPFLLGNDDTLKIGAPIGEHLLFESRFESGNLRKAIQVSPTDYELELAPDINHCGEHFQWFFFQLTDMHSDVPYTFEIINCAKKFSMFSRGMQPVLFSVTEAVRFKNPSWSRVGYSICYFCNSKFESNDPPLNSSTVENNTISCQASTQSAMELSSRSNRQRTEQNCTTSKETKSAKEGKQQKVKRKQTRTASESKTSEIDEKRNSFTLRFTIQFEHEADVCYIAYHFPYTYSRLQATLERLLSSTSPLGVYVNRQRLTSTLCSNFVPLLTITASPLEVKCREFVLITARVHPGEANSSWIMHGVISFLLSSHPLAVRARELFIFKLVPMLNPDGVINGSQRCSLSGHDLNRVWNDPSPALHPTVYHTKGLIQYMVDLVRKRPFVFIDMHGHSRKANVFMYGNNSKESWRQSDRDNATEIPRRSDALPEILDNISESFALKDCAFSITKNKEFSARVATWRQFGLEHVYTMESTYCGFDQGSKTGRQIMMEDLKSVGADLVKAMVRLWDVQLKKDEECPTNNRF